MKDSDVVTRNALLAKGFFPEVLPPCFDSTDLPRAIRGIIGKIREKKFHKKRHTSYIRYSGTKHDGNRRPYATPNPIPYFNVCEFIASRWNTFKRSFESNSFCISEPRVGAESEDRAIVISPLSELSEGMSKKIKYSPFILKTDIAQFFPSVYTHSIPWAAHGIESAKLDQEKNSKAVTFNALDWACQQCQDAQTRGILIGPDAFRIIAEFIMSKIDAQLRNKGSGNIIGAARHVDDYYIGVKSEVDAAIALSSLRDILQGYELHINDSKTKVINGLEPADDLWPQEIRNIEIFSFTQSPKIHELIDKAYDLSKKISSQSPMKLALRRLDNIKVYNNDTWNSIEPKLQRATHHFSHCIDYICLLLAKRVAVAKEIDQYGWTEVITILISRNVKLGYHHEVAWLLWSAFVCNLPISKDVIIEAANMKNSHIRAMLIAGYKSGFCNTDPMIKLGNGLSTTRDDWLENLVARATGYSKSHFSGNLNNEFEHLASKKVILIDFKKHMDEISKNNVVAISRSKYGYDDVDEDDDFDPLPLMALPRDFDPEEF